MRDIELATGLSLTDVSSARDESMFGGRSRQTIVELEFDHSFDNDGQIDFENYPSVLTVRDIGSDKEREKESAMAVFRSLQSIGVYRLLLVFDLQKIIGRSTS